METNNNEVRKKLNKYKIVNKKIMKGQGKHADAVQTNHDDDHFDFHGDDAVNADVDGYLSDSDDGGPIEILEIVQFTVRVPRRQS